MATAGSEVQWGDFLGILQVDLCAAGDQQLGRVGLAGSCGLMPRGGIVLVGRVHRGAGGEVLSDDIDAALVGGLMDRDARGLWLGLGLFGGGGLAAKQCQAGDSGGNKRSFHGGETDNATQMNFKPEPPGQATRGFWNRS